MTLAVSFQFSSPIRPKNSKKKLVKSQFHYCRFLSLVIAVYSQLALLYIYFSRETKILKLMKILLLLQDWQKTAVMVDVMVDIEVT